MATLSSNQKIFFGLSYNLSSRNHGQRFTAFNRRFNRVNVFISSSFFSTTDSSANYDTKMFYPEKCEHAYECLCVGVFGSEVRQLFFFFFFAEQLMHFACNACLLPVSWRTGEHIAGRCAYICICMFLFIFAIGKINKLNVQM